MDRWIANNVGASFMVHFKWDTIQSLGTANVIMLFSLTAMKPTLYSFVKVFFNAVSALKPLACRVSPYMNNEVQVFNQQCSCTDVLRVKCNY